MSERGLISVVVPVYNAETTITACLNSILASDYRSLEVIVVDDGSRDNSEKVCHQLATHDARLKVIHQTNQGCAAARAAGASQASGEWLCFVDADDTIPSHAISTLAARATDDVDIVLGNGYTLAALTNGRPTIDMAEFRHLAVRGEGAIGLPWGSLYRRTLATPDIIFLPKDVPMGEDYIFWLRMVFKTERPVAVVYEKVYCKGAATACASFKWTSAYAEKIQQYRLNTIPASQHGIYLKDMVSDCIENLLTVSMDEENAIWKHSTFWNNLKRDIRATGYAMPLKTRLFLALPSRKARHAWRRIADAVRRLL